MRFYLKKTLTWILAVICFLLFTFNFYNRHVWLLTRNETMPWGSSFHHSEEHSRVHIPKLNQNPVLRDIYKPTVNVTTERPNQLVTSRTVIPNVDVVWPTLKYYNNDRITNQLKYKSKSIIEKERNGQTIPLKKILLFSGFGSWQVKKGQSTFIEQKCLVNACDLTDQRSDPEIDLVLFTHTPGSLGGVRNPNQIWTLFMLESPYHTSGLSAFAGQYNWTATYRHDSDIVAPYEKFVLYDENVRTLPQNKSYAAGKTRKVAWFVSNCGARNTRKEYAEELKKYIDVDIYGSCGPHKCPRRDKDHCFNMLNKDYKFYLAFENSNCRDYITEKFFVNGLQHDVIPIVMGAAPEDYARAAPYHSYIHVDDFESPKALAEYLHELDQNDNKYNEYFQWKGTGRLINTFFWCRMCAMLHDNTRESHTYRDLEKWWRGPEVCIGKDNWRQHPRTGIEIVNDFLEKSDGN